MVGRHDVARTTALGTSGTDIVLSSHGRQPESQDIKLAILLCLLASPPRQAYHDQNELDAKTVGTVRLELTLLQTMQHRDSSHTPAQYKVESGVQGQKQCFQWSWAEAPRPFPSRRRRSLSCVFVQGAGGLLSEYHLQNRAMRKTEPMQSKAITVGPHRPLDVASMVVCYPSNFDSKTKCPRKCSLSFQSRSYLNMC